MRKKETPRIRQGPVLVGVDGLVGDRPAHDHQDHVTMLIVSHELRRIPDPAGPGHNRRSRRARRAVRSARDRVRSDLTHGLSGHVDILSSRKVLTSGLPSFLRLKMTCSSPSTTTADGRQAVQPHRVGHDRADRAPIIVVQIQLQRAVGSVLYHLLDDGGQSRASSRRAWRWSATAAADVEMIRFCLAMKSSVDL